ncbi:hypothetical protein K3495_g1049 [Podosphaera aphanis]|nr:hypothetical protein K3495_g1049 [Podosphaera aphanis]
MGLSKELRSDDFFHNKLINACRKIPACSFACFKPSETLTGLINDLKSSIKTYKESKEIEQTQFFTDQRYHKRSNEQGQNSTDTKTQTQHQYQPKILNKGKCYVCKNPGYWSQNQAFEHAITRTDPTDSNDPQSISNSVAFPPGFEKTQSIDSFSFLTSSRYANDIFYGIVIDTGASRNSTAGYSQYQALCKVLDNPSTHLQLELLRFNSELGAPPLSVPLS